MVQNSKKIVDKYLVSCAQLGDVTAQELLVRRFQKKFITHAYHLLGNIEHAKDAVQDGWLDIFRGLPTLKDEEAFAAWAFRIITRKCAKQISGFQKKRIIAEAISTESALVIQCHGTSDTENTRQAIHQALRKLNPEHRATISLFYMQDMAVAEIAVALDVPVGTVKSRLMNARQKMRVILEGDNHG